MAKKIAAEKFGVNGTEMALASNKLSFGGTLQADEADIDSLDTRVALETSIRGSKVDSIDVVVAAETSDRGDDVESLDTRVALETSIRGSKVTSIDGRISDEEDTTKYQTITLTSANNEGGNGLVNVTYTGYSSVPVVAGQMRCSDADKPIIACMLVGTPTTSGCTFALSANTAAGDTYYLDVITTI